MFNGEPRPATSIATDDPALNALFPRIQAFMYGCILGDCVDGYCVKGYRAPDTRTLWIRDHTHQSKAFRYWEPDMTSMVEHIIRHQMPDGSFYDFYHNQADRRHRVETESDVEYLVVLCCYNAWQATGDDEWIARQLPALERAMAHIQTDPWRWSAEHRLVRRGFTIDTWDFEFHNFPFKRQNHKRCIMFGDNSGMFAACRALERIYRRLNNDERAGYYAARAGHFRKRTEEVCWNGAWYTHQVHIDPVDLGGFDESRQLSLSNPYTINRGLPTHEQAVSIIKEYQNRRETAAAFAEWFSIDPAYPFPFTDWGWSTAPGNYLNGGIMPIVGGELARAAFEHGFEDYGVDILRRYHALVSPKGETYVWYHPGGRPGISGGETLPCDGWGSGAMLYALVEGLAGVTDEAALFSSARLAPRWPAAGCSRADVNIAYGASGANVRYVYEHKPGAIAMTVGGSARELVLHILLPKNARLVRGLVNGVEQPWAECMVEQSRYADARFACSGETTLRLEYRPGDGTS